MEEKENEKMTLLKKLISKRGYKYYLITHWHNYVASEAGFKIIKTADVVVGGFYEDDRGRVEEHVLLSPKPFVVLEWNETEGSRPTEAVITASEINEKDLLQILDYFSLRDLQNPSEYLQEYPEGYVRE